MFGPQAPLGFQLRPFEWAQRPKSYGIWMDFGKTRVLTKGLGSLGGLRRWQFKTRRKSLVTSPKPWLLDMYETWISGIYQLCQICQDFLAVSCSSWIFGWNTSFLLGYHLLSCDLLVSGSGKFLHEGHWLSFVSNFGSMFWGQMFRIFCWILLDKSCQKKQNGEFPEG